jgi:hypothetical protein
MGLLTAPLTLVRAPLRLTLRAWEIGLATAAEAARIGGDLLEPDHGRPDFSDYRAATHPDRGANGGGPGVEQAAPVAVADAPPVVPDELIPDHVDEEVVLVAETAEDGAEDGAGAELHVEAPWDGYDELTAADIRDRLAAASPAEAAAVELYETTHKNRSSVLDAAGRALRR